MSHDRRWRTAPRAPNGRLLPPPEDPGATAPRTSRRDDRADRPLVPRIPPPRVTGAISRHSRAVREPAESGRAGAVFDGGLRPPHRPPEVERPHERNQREQPRPEAIGCATVKPIGVATAPVGRAPPRVFEIDALRAPAAGRHCGSSPSSRTQRPPADPRVHRASRAAPPISPAASSDASFAYASQVEEPGMSTRRRYSIRGPRGRVATRGFASRRPPAVPACAKPDGDNSCDRLVRGAAARSPTAASLKSRRYGGVDVTILSDVPRVTSFA